MSDVPIKIQEFVIILSDGKSLHRILAQRWIEVTDIKTKIESESESENSIMGDIMIQPSKLYKISFNGERYQFVENSELHVSQIQITII